MGQMSVHIGPWPGATTTTINRMDKLKGLKLTPPDWSASVSSPHFAEELSRTLAQSEMTKLRAQVEAQCQPETKNNITTMIQAHWCAQMPSVNTLLEPARSTPS